MAHVPPRIISLARRLPGKVFVNRQLSGIYADPEIREGLRALLRMGCPITLGCPPREVWGKVAIHYFYQDSYTAVVGMNSWFDDREGNLRLDFDRGISGHGNCIWAPFVLAIAKVADKTPDSCFEDPEGVRFAELFPAANVPIRKPVSSKRRQKDILAVLRHLGGRATTRQIAEYLKLQVNGISQSLGAMSHKCLVTRISGTGANSLWIEGAYILEE